MEAIGRVCSDTRASAAAEPLVGRSSHAISAVVPTTKQAMAALNFLLELDGLPTNQPAPRALAGALRAQ